MSLVILGAGYTGRRLAELALARGLQATATSRAPESLHLPPACARLEFDVAKPATWTKLPAASDIIWCFPAEPYEAVVAFAQTYLQEKRHRLILFSTTSAYKIPSDVREAPLIDETWPIDDTRPRIKGEEYLRREYGAVVLRVAGIYGPGRHVLDWIRAGRVRASLRYVNLIHVEDLAAIALEALTKGRAGDIYNVSDGVPRRWIDICEEAQRRWGVPLPTKEIGSVGKRLSIGKLRREFEYGFRYPDLYEALDQIERAVQR